MPGAKSDNVYGIFGGSPNVQPSMGATPNLSVRASPQAFGSQVGQAVESAGKEGFEIANQFATMATEAKANDDYANKYVPAAIELRNKYDTLDSQDKVHGYEEYVNNLKELNTQFTQDKAPLYSQHMGAMINRHIEGEVAGANRELVASQLKFNGQSQADLLLANRSLAANNYNDPAMVKSINDQNDNIVVMQHIDTGHDPNVPEHQELIENAQKQQQGETAASMVNSALSRGDVLGANSIRTDYAHVLPAEQQLHLDNTLHQANMNWLSDTATHAITTGQPVPTAPGYAPAQVQAAVADTAHSNGVDQNHALTILQIESSNGQHLGKRGTIGQTGKSTTLEGQAADLVKAAKESQLAADKALGRPAEPWEQYICYQQGATGGSTLLKGAQDNPSAKAVDLLTGVYGNKKTAISAIVNNGGNTSMTSGDFLNFIQQKYNANAQRSRCDVPNSNLTNVPINELNSSSTGQTVTTEPVRLGDAIREASTKVADAVQPGVTPRQQLMEFDRKYNKAMEVAMAQPVGVKRDAIISGLNARRAEYQGNSSRYTEQLIGDVQTKLADPNFKDINQLTPEEQSELAINHPQTLTQVRAKAEANLKYGYKQASRITDVNSPNFYETLQRSLITDPDARVFNGVYDEGQLHALLGREDGTGINLKDYNDLKKSFDIRDQDRKKFLKNQMDNIKNANGDMDGLGAQRATNYYFAVNKVIDGRTAAEEPISYDPDNKNYVENFIPNPTASKEQQVSNMAQKIKATATAISPVPEDQKYKHGESAEEVAKRLGI